MTEQITQPRIPSDDFSHNALMRFAMWLKRYQLGEYQTLSSRRVSIRRAESVLKPDEMRDIRTIDFDKLKPRFIRSLYGNHVSSEHTASVYFSRFKSSCEDFLEWKKNPDVYLIMNLPTERWHEIPNSNHSSSNLISPLRSIEFTATPKTAVAEAVPIPLREGVTVKIHGLPIDLTAAEAQKIVRIISAFAVEEV